MKNATHINANQTPGTASTHSHSAAVEARPLQHYPNRWIKAPKSGYCPKTGLTRSALYQLAKERKIKTASIRQPGAIRGNRLFHLGSILAFLDQAAEQTMAIS